MWLINEEGNSFCLLGWLSLILKINWLNYYHWLSALGHNHTSQSPTLYCDQVLPLADTLSIYAVVPERFLLPKLQIQVLFRVVASCLAYTWSMAGMSSLNKSGVSATFFKGCTFMAILNLWSSPSRHLERHTAAVELREICWKVAMNNKEKQTPHYQRLHFSPPDPHLYSTSPDPPLPFSFLLPYLSYRPTA